MRALRAYWTIVGGFSASDRCHFAEAMARVTAWVKV